MSKRIVEGPNGRLKEEVERWDQCKHLCEEVCCEQMCDCCGDYPDTEEYCTKCEYFEEEDGVINEV